MEIQDALLLGRSREDDGGDLEVAPSSQHPIRLESGTPF